MSGFLRRVMASLHFFSAPAEDSSSEELSSSEDSFSERPPLTGELSPPGESFPPGEEPNRYNPTAEEVLKVKSLLLNLSPFPLELIDTIIDVAEYWPRSTSLRLDRVAIPDHSQENTFLLRSLPLGFGPGLGFESHGSGDSYYFEEPHPLQDPNQPLKDVSQEVFEWLRSKSNTRGEHPCRRIVFTIEAHDQGWANSRRGINPFDESFTWFDAGLEKLVQLDGDPEDGPATQFQLGDTCSAAEEHAKNAETASDPQTFGLRTVRPNTILRENLEENPAPYTFEHPLLPDESAVQKNRKSNRHWQTHVITWDYQDHIKPDSAEAQELEENGRGRETGSGELVRSLVVGDVVTLWGKARFPQWENLVKRARIDVYWAV